MDLMLLPQILPVDLLLVLLQVVVFLLGLALCLRSVLILHVLVRVENSLFLLVSIERDEHVEEGC